MAQIQGQLFVDLDTTFGAFARVARPFIQESISKGPAAEDTAIASLPAVRPFLANTTKLFAELRPGFRAIAPVQKDIGNSIVNGVKALALSPALNAQLDPTAQSLLNLSNNAPARLGIQQLTQFNTTLGPPLSFITPAQSVCNYASILFSNAASLASYNDGVANGQRFIVLQPPLAEGSATGPSSGPANGQGGLPTNFLHYNPYPNTASPGQTRECEAGNEGYPAGLSHRERPGQPGHPHLRPDPPADRAAGHAEEEEEGQEVTPDARPTPPPSPQPKDYDERVYRKGNPPHRVRNGLILIVLVIIGTYLAWTKAIPFQSHFELHAVFKNAANIRKDSPVRIAGVNVGKVVSIKSVCDNGLTGNCASNYSDVTFTVDDSGQPIHSDAQIAIRPRIFLEGNFFLDVSPGSPSAHSLSSGDMIPVTQTSTAVQLDQILTSLQAPDRANLQKLLEGYGTALTHKPTAADDATQDPDVQGLTAAEAINKSFGYAQTAARDSAIVNEALPGHLAA